MILTLIGGDLFSKEKRIEEYLKKNIKDSQGDSLSKLILYATDTNIVVVDKIISEASAVSMFSAKQIIIVRRAEAFKTTDTKTLSDWLKTSPDADIIFEFEKLASNTTLYKALQKSGSVEKYESPKPWELDKWIHNIMLSHFGRAIHPSAARYLAEALGTDTSLIAAELEKILVYDSSTKEISLETVKTMVVPQREILAYEIRESFGTRNATAYVKKLKDLLDNGVTAVQIASALYYYTIRLLHIKTMLEQNMSPENIALKLGANKFLFCTKENEPKRAQKWSKALLHRVVKRLADLDFEMKSGLCSTRTAQELALAALIVR